MAATENPHEMTFILCVGEKYSGDAGSINRAFIYLSSEIPVTFVSEDIV